MNRDAHVWDGNYGVPVVFTPQWRKYLMWRFGEQWVYLILLGVITGFFSWAMDFGIDFGLECKHVYNQNKRKCLISE